VISAHGNADQVVPYALGSFGGLLNGIFDLHGSYMVDSVARQRGVCSYLYTMEGRDHPSESMGLEYFYSIVYRIMLRMQAVRNQQSFCCPLNVDITPNDTLFYGASATQATLNAVVTNDNGNAQLHWCTMPCQLSETGLSITITADSTLKYVAATVSEGNCMSGDLHIVYDSAFMATAIHRLAGNEFAFSVYPQPASTQLNVRADLSNYKGSYGAIEITDMAGRKLLSEPFAINGQLNRAIDLSAIPTGSYMLLLIANSRPVGAKQVTVNR
ncbi:MAG TPA: T9SS type A sorting domain-containing protein, partial [Chitinophagales bacterium]|nr:T9SS type A sorting domain-containing protein [Chitinophagales bacterium]